MRTIHKQLVQVKRQIASSLRTSIWIAVVSICCVQGVTEVVVDFKSYSHQKHLVFDAEFANLDAEGNHELVLIENGYNGSLHVAVSISQISEESRVNLWRGQRLAGLSYKVLVGNIDSDERDEVIVHRPESRLDDTISPDTLRVIEFEDDQYRERLYTSPAGQYGALIDIDDDGKSELVLIEDAIPDFGVDEARSPSRIRIYSFDDKQFNLLAEFDAENTIQCVATGDVDGDGQPEIVAQEKSNDAKIRHQISVYSVAKDGEISHQFSKEQSPNVFEIFLSRERDANLYRWFLEYICVCIQVSRAEIRVCTVDRSQRQASTW